MKVEILAQGLLRSNLFKIWTGLIPLKPNENYEKFIAAKLPKMIKQVQISFWELFFIAQ